MRAKYGDGKKLPTGDWEALKKNAEVARFMQFVMGAIIKKEKNSNYTGESLKNDLVKEVKKVRAVVGDEKVWLPEPLLSHVLTQVWKGGK